jgi:hypothetical protein
MERWQAGSCDRKDRQRKARVPVSPASHPHTQPHLEAIDVQDGNGQCVLLWGHQCVDPGNKPAKQQCVQDLGDSIPGAEAVLSWMGHRGRDVGGLRPRHGGAWPHLASTALSTVRGVNIFSRMVSWEEQGL